MFKNSKGNLNLYLNWPSILIIYFLLVTFIVYKVNAMAGFILFIFVVVFSVFAIYLRMHRYNNLFPAIEKFVENKAKEFGINMAKMDIPYAVFSIDGRLIWGNDSFLGISKNLVVGELASGVFPELNKILFKDIKDDKINILTKIDDKIFKVYLHRIELNTLSGVNNIKIFDDISSVIVSYFSDETELYILKQENDNNKQVTGIIYIDNYEEVTENMEDSKASMLIAMLDRKLTRYISYNCGIIKKLEKDKYFFVTMKKDIEDMIKDRFSILEQTKDIIGGENIPLTLSIGVGYEGKSIETNHDLARIALDMALARGGDQAVVRKGQDTLFFGGKAASQSSNARVRARVKSISFKETLDTKDKVLIMGHKDGDLDSFGASIGTYIMAKHMGKDVHIVVNTLTNVVEEMKERMLSNETYDKDMFIDGEKALSFADDNTLLIIVDHNVDKMSDEPKLHNMKLDTVVFDHHRVSQNSINDAILTYIDSSASSTCELVTELMIYFDDILKLRQIEADAMLGGITIDTLNFSYQTTSKTFDAASFLRKKGADTDRVRKLLRTDKNSINVKNDVISKTEFYKDKYAIAILEDIPNVEKNVLKAEIANELIAIKGVIASIVILKEGNEYLISSRSIDEMNVQILMEKLGGGGHRGSAAATIKANSFDEVVTKIKETIDSMEEGDK